MAHIALNGTEITETTRSGHISIDRWQQTGSSSKGSDSEGNPLPPTPDYGWVGGYSTSAKVNGTAQATTNNVYIQGTNVVLQGDSTTESDSYSLSSDERYSGGSHSSATGSVSSGNSKNVYIGGKSVALVGSSVTTHASTTSSLRNTRASSTVNIG